MSFIEVLWLPFQHQALSCQHRSHCLFFALSVLLACNCKSNTVFSKSIVCGATDKLVLTVSINTLKLLTYLNPELFNFLVTKVFLRTRDWNTPISSQPYSYFCFFFFRVRGPVAAEMLGSSLGGWLTQFSISWSRTTSIFSQFNLTYVGVLDFKVNAWGDDLKSCEHEHKGVFRG